MFCCRLCCDWFRRIMAAWYCITRCSYSSMLANPRLAHAHAIAEAHWRMDCANCGASEGTVPGIPVHKPCSRCKITYYCSVRCQKQHWKVGGHKKRCVALVDRSVAKVEAAEAEGGESWRKEGGGGGSSRMR